MRRRILPQRAYGGRAVRLDYHRCVAPVSLPAYYMAWCCRTRGPGQHDTPRHWMHRRIYVSRAKGSQIGPATSSHCLYDAHWPHPNVCTILVCDVLNSNIVRVLGHRQFVPEVRNIKYKIVMSIVHKGRLARDGDCSPKTRCGWPKEASCQKNRSKSRELRRQLFDLTRW